jgi:hypothetical protein
MEDIERQTVCSACSLSKERQQSWVHDNVRARLRYELAASQRYGLHPSMGEATIYTISNTFSLLWVFKKNMRDCGESSMVAATPGA